MVDTERKNIYVVDDDPINLNLLRGILSRHYNVYDFVDPEEALNSMKRNVRAVDLLITDGRMPGMNGDVLIERFREICWIQAPSHQVPIFYLSAIPLNDPYYSDLRNRLVAMDVEMMEKPYRPFELLGKISDYLNPPS